MWGGWSNNVWESIDHLADFVDRSGHAAVMLRRREWFERIGIHMALWWVPAGHLPSFAEAEARLAHLQEHGPTPDAFAFKIRFLAAAKIVVDDELGAECRGVARR